MGYDVSWCRWGWYAQKLAFVAAEFATLSRLGLWGRCGRESNRPGIAPPEIAGQPIKRVCE